MHRRDRRGGRPRARGGRDHRSRDARRNRRLQGQPAPPCGDAGRRARERAAAGLRRTAEAEPGRQDLRRGLPGGRAEDAADQRRLQLLQRAHPPAPEAGLRARQHAGHAQRPAHRHALRPALGRHRRRRREEARAARGVRVDGHRHRAGHRGGRRRQRPADDDGGRSVDRHPKPALREKALVSITQGGWTERWKSCADQRDETGSRLGLPGPSTPAARAFR